MELRLYQPLLLSPMDFPKTESAAVLIAPLRRSISSAIFSMSRLGLAMGRIACTLSAASRSLPGP